MSTSLYFTLNTGPHMPLIAVGTYKIRGYDKIYNILDVALKIGYRSIDTAAVYKNEENIGKALKILLPKHGLRREEIFITSKLAPLNQGSGCYEACLDSIRKLDVDYLDLFLIHWPGSKGLKPVDSRHPERRQQSWKAMEVLFEEGKVRAIGVSNYTLRHMNELLPQAKIKPAVLQIEHHPYLIQNDLVDLCRQHGIHFQAYSSLGTTGNDKLLTDPVIVSIAEKHNKTPAQLLLRWAVQQNIGVIPKSTNLDHIAENIAIYDFTLSEEEMTRISGLNRNEHFAWNPESIT